MININEYVLSVDEFLKPKVYTKANATNTLLARLILLEPGTFQTHPEMGVGLVSKFRYSDVADLSVLRSRVKNQIATYLPTLQDVDVSIEQDDTDKNRINISIAADGTLYTFTFNSETKALQDLMSNS